MIKRNQFILVPSKCSHKVKSYNEEVKRILKLTGKCTISSEMHLYEEIEVTPDHVSLHTAEGHFCSLLKSSVIVLSSLSLSAESLVNAILKAPIQPTSFLQFTSPFKVPYPAFFLRFR